MNREEEDFDSEINNDSVVDDENADSVGQKNDKDTFVIEPKAYRSAISREKKLKEENRILAEKIARMSEEKMGGENSKIKSNDGKWKEIAETYQKQGREYKGKYEELLNTVSSEKKKNKLLNAFSQEGALYPEDVVSMAALEVVDFDADELDDVIISDVVNKFKKTRPLLFKKTSSIRDMNPRGEPQPKVDRVNSKEDLRGKTANEILEIRKKILTRR